MDENTLIQLVEVIITIIVGGGGVVAITQQIKKYFSLADQGAYLLFVAVALAFSVADLWAKGQITADTLTIDSLVEVFPLIYISASGIYKRFVATADELANENGNTESVEVSE